MKKVFISLLTLVFMFATVPISYASDWDKAGKVLTVIEGLRLVTGGKVDVIGNITGVVHGEGRSHHRHPRRHHFKHRRHKRHKVVRHYHCTQEKYWIPDYQWVKKWIPEHEEYSEEYGKVFVEGHFIKVKEESGGRWEYKEVCQ